MGALRDDLGETIRLLTDAGYKVKESKKSTNTRKIILITKSPIAVTIAVRPKKGRINCTIKYTCGFSTSFNRFKTATDIKDPREVYELALSCYDSLEPQLAEIKLLEIKEELEKCGIGMNDKEFRFNAKNKQLTIYGAWDAHMSIWCMKMVAAVKGKRYNYINYAAESTLIEFKRQEEIEWITSYNDNEFVEHSGHVYNANILRSAKFLDIYAIEEQGFLSKHEGRPNATPYMMVQAFSSSSNQVMLLFDQDLNWSLVYNTNSKSGKFKGDVYRISINKPDYLNVRDKKLIRETIETCLGGTTEKKDQ